MYHHHSHKGTVDIKRWLRTIPALLCSWSMRQSSVPCPNSNGYSDSDLSERVPRLFLPSPSLGRCSFTGHPAPLSTVLYIFSLFPSMNSSPYTTPPFLEMISYPGGGSISDSQLCIFPTQPLRDLTYCRNVRQCSYLTNTSGSPITTNRACARVMATNRTCINLTSSL